MNARVDMNLFDECIEALGNEVIILSEPETRAMFETLTTMFPITPWGRIDWESVDKKFKIENTQEIFIKLKIHYGEKINAPIYLLWNYSDAPVVQADLLNVIKVIDDVTAVGSDTWIICPSIGYVIEYFHEGEVTLGFLREN